MPHLKGFRFPREIIAHAVWAYHRFALSTADVEDLLRRVRSHGTLDEVVIMISGRTHRLWRAIYAAGDVLDILVQPRRNAKAAKRFLRRLTARFDDPRVIVTDKLRSYIKPIHDLAPGADHRAHKGLNNRAEVSHRPTRRREKIMGRFKSPWQAQRFLYAHGQINTLFQPRRYKLSSMSYRHARSEAFRLWGDYTLEMTA